MRSGVGMGVLGLAGLCTESGSAAAPGGRNPLAPKEPHFKARAKHIIHVFCNGGASHLDTFDPKPELTRNAGKKLPYDNLRTERKTGACFPSPYKFTQHGESGITVSELFPHTARHVDDMCIIRSMHADVPNHEPSLLLMNCGESTLPRPSMGSWLTYGLGTENQNLPGFIAMCPGGYPVAETQNWQSAFLPGVFQGTYIDSKHTELEKLLSHIKNDQLPAEAQRRQLDALAALNRQHAAQRGGDSQLESRIQSFELAFRMQMEASDAFDLSKEPKHVLESYGPGVHARQLLIARRLAERGVRCVQLYHGSPQPWDNHTGLEAGHRKLAGEIDQPIAALLTDLKQCGLLDDTLVLWSGEFGRTPTVELPGGKVPKNPGRDHNHWGFTVWMAGGGVKGGQAYGATDEFSFQAVEDPVHIHDLHATILHLFGFDHTQLTYRYSGRDFRLTDVHGEVVDQIVA